jgi:plastocyanin
MKPKSAVIVAALAVLVLTLAGCSSNNKVGNKQLLDVKDEASKGLGQTTTTQAQTSTSSAGALAIGQKTTTTRPVATTAPPKAETATVITINGDNSNVPQFDPSPAPVYVGGLIKWTNNDSKPRSVVAINPPNAFPPSGDIAPGASYSWRAVKAGVIDYQDGTRPYANGQLQVVAR